MKKITCFFLGVLLVLSLVGCGSDHEDTEGEKSPGNQANETPTPTEQSGPTAGVMREDMTAMDIVYDMGLGWNLGNTLEATGSNSTTVYGFETSWGAPFTNEKIIEGVKAAGFDSIRIPVAWSNLMDESTYTISPDLMDRVRVVVDCCLKHDLYVVLNIHWDGGWWSNLSTEYDKYMGKYTRIWEQISEEFKDYDDHLIFESLNEEGCFDDLWNRWGGSDKGKADAYGILNDLNQNFVNIVRQSGGNNAKRHLLLAGYATDIDLTCDPAFVIPQDTIENHLIVSVHYYTPSTFAILDKDASWGKVQTNWGTDADYEVLKKNFQKLTDTFVSKGIPVIVGEYGSVSKGKEEGAVNRFLSAVATEAWTRGICPMLWDASQHYNRQTFKMRDPELSAAFGNIKNLSRPEIE